MIPLNYTTLSQKERRELRLLYIEEQNGKCFYCNEDLDKDPPKYVTDRNINWRLFPPNFTKAPIHLQHCHKTGMTEGAVHAYCNAVMWQYEGR